MDLFNYAKKENGKRKNAESVLKDEVGFNR